MRRVQKVVLVVLLSCLGMPAMAQERIVGLPCEGCEAVFVGLPIDVPSSARIVPEGEAGEKLVIEGTVRDTSARPVAGIIIYAYHTDQSGIYPKDEALKGTAAYRHGRLRGWVRSDSLGRYRFETIRPGGYPGSSLPEHIHMHVIEPGRCTYYIADIMFDDDPRLKDSDRELHQRGRGGSGLVRPARESAGGWTVKRDIVLGLRVPGYEQCAR